MKRSEILLVDDNPDNIYLLEVILQAQNFATVSACNGREAIEVVKNRSVDLILMDVMMPEMDGFEASRHIRNRRESAHIPIIMMTAKKRELGDVLRGLDEGALEYLTKPFEEEELLARVKSMLRIKHMYDDNKDLLDKVLKQQKLMDQEMKVAARVQYALLPSADSFQGGKLKIDSFYKAAASVGGDFYEFINYETGRTAFLIADVSGHGPSAAMIVAILKTLLMEERADYPPPSEMLRRLNQKLVRMIPEEHFITAFFCVVDTARSTVTYSRAGHPVPFIYSAQRETPVELDTGGEILGMFEDVAYGEKVETLKPSDRILMYSDGIFEVPDKKGELFGLGRLRNFVRDHHTLPGKGLIELLVETVDAYWDGETIRDDVAIINVEIQ